MPPPNPGMSGDSTFPADPKCPPGVQPPESVDAKDKLAAVNRIADRQPDPLLQFFAYAHLPEKLQAVSKPFALLAAGIADTLPRNPERTTALRKLLEAKDCAVRSLLFVEPPFAKPVPTPPHPVNQPIEPPHDGP